MAVEKKERPKGSAKYRFPNTIKENVFGNPAEPDAFLPGTEKAHVRKLISRHGFTLTETLSTLVVMSLVGIMVTVGVTTAAKVYRQVTEYAEAQMLLSNTLTLIKNELIYAKPDSEVRPMSFSDDNRTIVFEHVTNGVIKLSAVSETTGGISISIEKDSAFTTPQPLVGYQKKEDIFTDWKVTYDETNKQFDIDLSVNKKENDSTVELVRIDDIKIVPVNI